MVYKCCMNAISEQCTCTHNSCTLLIYYSISLIFYFRYINYNGYSYTGGLKQGMRNGKGKEEWEDGSREIAYRVGYYETKEGTAKYFDKNGNEEDRFYKNGELVKNNLD